MPYLGDKPLTETAPNHPFARSQISFGVKRPDNSKTPSRTESAPEESQAPANDLRRKCIPAQFNGILVAAMPLKIEPAAAAQSLIEELVEINASYVSRVLRLMLRHPTSSSRSWTAGTRLR